MEIGNTYSKFYAVANQFSDSLSRYYANEDPNVALSAILAQTQNQPISTFSNFYVYKNFPKFGSTTFISYVMAAAGKYEVTEQLKIDWNIKDESKNILGYNCRKATCRFAGRNYEAWFTMEIPIQDGPYKFQGLPGLIVNIADEEYEHVFELIRIENVQNKPMYTQEQQLIRTDMKHFVNALYASKSDLIKLMEEVTASDESLITKAIARVQRKNNFIERY